MGEIRMFGGNFAPQGWAFCNGALLSIAQYTAMYAIVGTIYGGDGQNTFALPNLCGRVAVGAGQGPGLSYYDLGEQTGVEAVTLTTSQMPVHTHTGTSTGGGGAITATATLYGSTTGTGVSSPANAVLGIDSSATASIYGADTGTLVPMSPNGLAISNFSPGKLPVVSLSAAGGSQPHTNIQPYLAVSYIICIEGIFPSRN